MFNSSQSKHISHTNRSACQDIDARELCIDLSTDIVALITMRLPALSRLVQALEHEQTLIAYYRVSV